MKRVAAACRNPRVEVALMVLLVVLGLVAWG